VTRQIVARASRNLRRCARALALVSCALAATASSFAQDAAARAETELAEARRLFDALDYERAVPVLDRAIVMLEPMAPGQLAAASALVSAYEMRARARFGLGDQEGAQADFRALVAVDPAFTLAGDVSPRVVALLDDVKKSAVGSLVLTVEPADAAVELNGRPVSGSEPLVLAAADYTVKASRIGYRPVEEPVTVAAGETRQFSLAMERVSAAVFVVTAPPDVEVIVDGVPRGRTEAGALPTDYAELPGQLGVAADAVSRPFVLSDLTPGAHSFRFRRDCHVSEERRLVVEGLADYRLDPIQMTRAVGVLEVASAPPGANVFVDGEARGVAPITIEDVCEGSRVVELRSSQGRYVDRMTVKAGERLTVSGAMKPAFALLPAGAGTPAGGMAAPDLRDLVERAMAASRQVTLFVPSGSQVNDALEGMPREWLAFDGARRPIGAAAVIPPAARRDLSAKLARALEVQGVAAVTRPAAGSTEAVISLLAAGAGEPDVVRVTLESAESVSAAMARFDYVPPLTRPGIGVLAVDVADVQGLPIARVEPGSAAAQAGLAARSVISRADGQEVRTASALLELLSARQAGDQVSLEVQEPGGVVRTVSLPVTFSPRLISAADQTLLFNPLAVALRARLAAAAPSDRAIVQMNLGVALLRLGDLIGAREQLEAARLPAGPGISQGTRQYLLGLVHEGLGDLAAARAAWEVASASEGLLTEHGPPVRLLAAAKLRAPGSQPR
jgi:PDZ domain/PEGA domain